MKEKIFNLGLIMLLMLPMISRAQLIVTDSVRHELKRYLYEVHDTFYPDAYDSLNLRIYSEIGKKWINKPGESTQPIDVLIFRPFGSHLTSHAMLIYERKYLLINMCKSYPEILKTVIDFVDNNPDMDKRILPLFIHKVHKNYMLGTTDYESGGPWYKLWYGNDSLSRTLNLEFKDWIQ